jgi:hypothetical protein
VSTRPERAWGHQAGDAPARSDGEEQGRGNPAERRPGRRRKRQPRERQVRGCLDDRGQQADHEGTGQAEQHRDERRGTGTAQEAADQGERPRRHRRRHERDDHEVQERGQGSEPAEGEQHDREGRRLGRERDGEALDDKPGQAWQPRPEAGLDGRAPGEQAGGRRRRELEPGVRDGSRGGHDDDHDGPRERSGSGARAARLARQQGDAGHHGRTQHRRRGAGEDRVQRDRADRRDRPPPPCPRSQECRDEPGDEGDVPAGDGDDVREASGGEVRRQVAIHSLPQPDQDAGGQAGSRLGERPRQRIAGVRPDALDEPVRVVYGRQRPDRARGQRRRDSGPRKVGAVCVIRR